MAIGMCSGDSMMMALKGITVSLLIVMSFIGLNNYGVEGGTKGLSIEEDLELERQLKILNKPPLKTFQTEVGDVLDCVDIHKQPAFDNPLLKNHKIQMRPSFSPKRVVNEGSSETKPLQVKFMGEECPPGSVPIRRTRKEDLVRAKSLSREFSTDIGGQRKVRFPGQYVVDIKKDYVPPYYGAAAFINVYNLPVARGQFSNAQIWIENGPYYQTNNIQAGWTVNPSLYGDNLTRLFTFWTGDGYNKTGCYNTLCPGFVQVSEVLCPSAQISNVSTYGGQQFEIKVSVYQDRETGNWWLSVTEEDVHVGYWPKSIFTHLAKGARDVVWGGLAQAGPDGVSPPMGNGHFRDDNACYFTQMEYVDKGYERVHLMGVDALKKRMDDPHCYDIKFWGKPKFRATFGGPGGRCR